MRRARRRLAALLTALILIFPVYADEAPSSDAEAAAESTEEAAEPEASGSKAMSAVLLLSSVSGALVIVALIYRGVDKAKYL